MLPLAGLVVYPMALSALLHRGYGQGIWGSWQDPQAYFP